MVDSSDPTPLPPEPTTACRGLSLAGLVLIVVFLTTVATVAFPVRLLNPAWQLRLGGMLINMAPMPLIGLGLLHLAVLLDPLDPLLMRRLRPAAHLGVLVALGYLLLAPLIGNAALAQLRDQVSVRDARLRQASFNLEQLRQAVSAASSVPDLEARMNALQGPKLDSADRLQPLPRLRTRAYALLDQASEQLSRAKANATPINPWVQLPAIARHSVASLALALGFAGLAQRPGSEISLLAELVDRFELSVLRRRISRDNRAGTLSDQDYVAQLTDEPE
ncbi:MAG: HpsJ family protein [Synechococcaceae cyanobacterium]